MVSMELNQIRQFATRIMILLGALSVTACATVVRGPNTDFQVASEPPGAQVTTDLLTRESQRAYDRIDPSDSEALAAFMGETHGCDATPCAFEVSRRSEFQVTVTLEGYHPVVVDITSGFGSEGRGTSVAGGAVVATGAYVASTALLSSLSSAITTMATFGTVTTGASAGSFAAAGAATGLLFGGAMIGIDLASGAMLNLQPNPLVLILIPEDQPLPSGDEQFIETEEQLEEVLEQLGHAEASAD